MGRKRLSGPSQRRLTALVVICLLVGVGIATAGFLLGIATGFLPASHSTTIVSVTTTKTQTTTSYITDTTTQSRTASSFSPLFLNSTWSGYFFVDFTKANQSRPVRFSPSEQLTVFPLNASLTDAKVLVIMKNTSTLYDIFVNGSLNIRFNIHNDTPKIFSYNGNYLVKSIGATSATIQGFPQRDSSNITLNIVLKGNFDVISESHPWFHYHMTSFTFTIITDSLQFNNFLTSFNQIVKSA